MLSLKNLTANKGITFNNIIYLWHPICIQLDNYITLVL